MFYDTSARDDSNIMLGKNKLKFDPKVRFQNRNFKNRLFEQRNYKRTQRNIPQTKGEVFLSKLGLGSWAARLTTILILMFLVYWVYIPNYFFVKTVNLQGGGGEVETSAKNLTNLFLKKYLPWPQGNLFFLSKDNLKNYLIEKDKRILSVEKIDKDFPSTLNIELTLRGDSFLIETASSTYFTLSQDGVVTGQIYKNASGTLPIDLTLIKLNQGSSLPDWQKPLKDNWFNFISNLFSASEPELKTKIDYFKTNSLSDPFAEAKTQTGYVIKFDMASDFTKTLAQLKSLISSLEPSDIKNLKYIDVRFTGRAYICYKNSTCAEDILPPINTSTTTQTIIN